METEWITVGELARLMGVSVRTLQYYDREGLLKPSSMSEGGRRLYSAKDIVKLHQILSFKYLGFSLEEIKSRLFTLDSPKDVALALERQNKAIEEQIEELEEVRKAINSLHAEVLAVQKVDFTKYAQIIELLKNGNECYWVWKYFDDSLANHIVNRFGDNAQAGLKIYETYMELLDEALNLKRRGVAPESKYAQRMARKWWNMIMEFTGGDMSLIPQLVAFNDNKSSWNNPLAQKQQEVDDYMDKALSHYIAGLEKE